MKQLGDMSHLFNSLPHSPGLHEPQSMVNVEERVMYDGDGEWSSIAPSIFSSSHYSDEVALKEGPLEGETQVQAIASANMEAIEKDEIPQDRFKFICCDGDDWITMEQYQFGPSLSSLVDLTAEKHTSEG